MRVDTKSMTGKTTEGLAWGVSKRAMAAGAGGILRTGVYTYKPGFSFKEIFQFFLSNEDATK